MTSTTPDPDASEPRMAVFGLGRLGTHLAAALAPLTTADAPLILCSSSESRGQAIALACESRVPELGIPRPEVITSVEAALTHSDLCFFTIPDSMLSQAASNAAALEIPFSGKAIVHCSGASTNECLSPLAEAGALVGSFHPIQSFPPLSPEELIEAPNAFEGITFGIDAEEPLLGMLKSLASALGGNSIVVPPDADARAAYHAASVVASNTLVALMADAVAIMKEAGIGALDAQKALWPLMQGTIGNLQERLPSVALTGPIARGDIETIERHIKALQSKSRLIEPYLASASRIRALALGANLLRDDAIERLDQLLKDQSQKDHSQKDHSPKENPKKEADST